MARIRVVHTQIDGYPHLEALTEIRQALVAELASIGFRVTESRTGLDSTGKNIVLGSHVLDDATLASLPSDTIIYNFEQIDSTSMLPPARLAAFERFDVWDYSPRNIEGWRALGVDATHVPVGHSSVLERIKPAIESDIDVLFYGSINDRRLEVLRALEARGLVVRAEFGVYGVSRDALIARSKTVLNVNFYEAKILEIVRLSYLFANRAAVVSELADGVELPAGIDTTVATFAPYDELVDATAGLVADDGARTDQEDRALAAMRAIPYANTLEAVLGRPAPTAPRPGATGRTGGGGGRKKKKRR